jgi:hypothetical protein
MPVTWAHKLSFFSRCYAVWHVILLATQSTFDATIFETRSLLHCLIRSLDIILIDQHLPTNVAP